MRKEGLSDLDFPHKWRKQVSMILKIYLVTSYNFRHFEMPLN